MWQPEWEGENRYMHMYGWGPSLFTWNYHNIVNCLSALCVLVAQSCPTLCNPMDCSPARLLCPWNSPTKNTGVGCHSLLQGLFPTPGLNLGLLHCREILYHLSYEGSLPRYQAQVLQVIQIKRGQISLHMELIFYSEKTDNKKNKMIVKGE